MKNGGGPLPSTLIGTKGCITFKNVHFIPSTVFTIPFLTGFRSDFSKEFYFISIIKVTPHRIFLKRAIFEKIILFDLLAQICTKITKKITILKFRPTYPLFAKRNFLGLGNPVKESGTPV